MVTHLPSYHDFVAPLAQLPESLDTLVLLHLPRKDNMVAAITEVPHIPELAHWCPDTFPQRSVQTSRVTRVHVTG